MHSSLCTGKHGPARLTGLTGLSTYDLRVTKYLYFVKHCLEINRNKLAELVVICLLPDYELS